MPAPELPALFRPQRVGALDLQHRIVMAPMTRFRANAAHALEDISVQYYAQRADTRGTLLVSEATFIAPEAGGFDGAPGIWSSAQVGAWRKKVADAVHARGAFLFVQLWALGRTAKPAVLARDELPFVAASAVPLDPAGPAPRALTVQELQEYVQWYARAAANAVHGAGCDGVEIHGANGFLPDQFLQEHTNVREDAYGGSVEGRMRFVLEVLDAVVREVGAERVGLRLSPWSTFLGMGMEDPVPTFSALVIRIRELHPRLAYIHVVEPATGDAEKQSNDFLRKIWAPRPFIAAGGFDGKRAEALCAREGEGALVAFGKLFIANPDLPRRLRQGHPLNEPRPATFYVGGVEGYVDYPFLQEGEEDE
ncbi:NADH:flavin oxidoreductase/NADH oxidase [Artomyces pyxidatus]|uniref:NADH:flavin oxidoreductase/NADH oxidase n=1 Tax=Artomyces pyxidatus TaxID=48021 RepID=A0ACB8T498_9AGAM|nr:NADH:flavin oxidoreductase/NADH oxidase [Artomyces pyxidatus]